MKKRKEEFEERYSLAYDKLILVSYDMEQVLENCRKYKLPGLFETEHSDYKPSSRDIDIKLEMMIMKISKLTVEIIHSKTDTIFDIILYRLNEKKLNRRLYNISIKTHFKLLQVLEFLSKRESKKTVLDCKIQKPSTGEIVIKCGICPILLVFGQKINHTV
jgi:hypothetical protein